MNDAEITQNADAIISAMDTVSSIAPISVAHSAFGLDDGYRVAAALTGLRNARGERPIGWKIGFTNQTIWDEYGVHAPIWGPMYNTTLAHVDPAEGTAQCRVSTLVEPRIEPEIAFRLASTPSPGMDDDALMACVDAVAHGVEIVQSVFPQWRFTAADTVAAGAVHGCYCCGPLVPVSSQERSRWVAMLRNFEIGLSQEGRDVDRGSAVNILDHGPLEALRHFVRGHAKHSAGAPLEPGQIVTTGTITRAFPVQASQSWRTEVHGLPLPGLELVLT